MMEITPLNANEIVGTNVRGYRARRRLTQRDLADRMRQGWGLKWHPKTVSVVESGDRPVKAAELLVLCGLLGVQLDDMLDPAP